MALIVLGRIASPPADVLPVEQTPRRQFACPTAGNVPVRCWLAHVLLMIIMAASKQTESKGSMSTETSWRKNKGNSTKSANETQTTAPTPRSPREVPKQLGYGLATLATALVPNLGRGRCEHRIFLLVPSIPQWPNEIVLGSACCSLDKYVNPHRQG